MKCTRCTATMLKTFPVRFYACSTDLSEELHTAAYRCLACGHYSDLRVLRNRQAAGEVVAS